MRSANLSFKQLRAFMALAEVRNFTRAAAACHLSQPAFSLLIQAVEQELGARLFHRDTRKVDLTAPGLAFFESMQQLVPAFDAAVAAVRQAGSAQEGSVAIAALPSLAGTLLPDLLTAFQQVYPEATVKIRDISSDGCLALVRTGDADVGLLSEDPQDAQLACHPLFEEPYFILCRKDHPLAGRPSLSITDVLACQVIHLATNASIGRLLKERAPATGRLHVVEVENLQTARGMAEAGLGLTVVARSALGQYESPWLAAVPLAEPGLTRKVYLVYRKGAGSAMRGALIQDLLARFPQA